MADEKYIIPKNPAYQAEDIRKLQDNDPASATNTFNPLIQKVLESIAHNKKNKADIGKDGKVPEGQLPEYAKLDDKGKPGGFASLNEQGKVPASELPSLDYVPTSEKGKPDGVALLDSSGKVPADQLPDMNYIPTKEKGAVNGVPSLDANGKVPESQLPLQRGIIAQGTPPGNTKLGWIDTANGKVLKYYNGTDWVPVGSVWG